MKNVIKAIETRYKGYRFRSRLEARWAVFFDALGIEWEYELEGYDLPDGGSYLPDFYLPSFCMWVEVKPFHDFDKAERFTQALADEGIGCIWAAAGVPSSNSFLCILHDWSTADLPDLIPTKIKYESFFLAQTQSGEWYSFLTNVQRHAPFFSTDIQFAVNAARSARFEFGQEGAA